MFLTEELPFIDMRRTYERAKERMIENYQFSAVTEIKTEGGFIHVNSFNGRQYRQGYCE